MGRKQRLWALGLLFFSGWVTSAAHADPQTAPHSSTASEDVCIGCEKLPEVARSPLLYALRSCAALLSSSNPPETRIDACFADTATRLRAFAASGDPRVEQARAELQRFLEAAPRNPDHQSLAAQLDERVHALRLAAAAQRAREAGHVALISEGGVSLGNWQSGMLYLITEYLKRQRSDHAPVFPTITGASAGAVNGLIAASDGCEKPETDPRNSLFYQVWTSLGVIGRHGAPGLLGDASSTYALFSDAALGFAMSLATKHFRDRSRYPAGRCDVQFGITLTHLDDNQVTIHQNAQGTPVIRGPSLREQFALALQFQADAGPVASEGPTVLQATNLPLLDDAGGDALSAATAGVSRLPLLGVADDARAPVELDTLLLAVRASGAFPGAFPPVQNLPFRRMNNDHGVGPQQWATFIDGGVFDNTPVGFAIELEQARQHAGPIHEPLNLEQALVPEAPTTYLLVEPSAVSWTYGNAAHAARDDDEHSDIISKYLSFLGRFVGSSRNAALAEAAERWPFLRARDASGLQPRLLVPNRNLPIAGEQLASFLAFFEQDFRVFDFYVGMADAAAMLDSDPWLHAADAPSWPTLVHSPEFACLQAYYAQMPKLGARRITARNLPAACAQLGTADRPKQARGEALEEQTLITRLDSAAPADAATLTAEAALSANNFRALIVAMHNYKLWTQRDAKGEPGAAHYDPGYTSGLEFDSFFGELQQAGFHFVDLARVLRSSDAVLSSDQARSAVRAVMQRGVDQLAIEQPKTDARMLVSVVGRGAADQYYRLRPTLVLGVGVATQGVDVVPGLRLSDQLRLDLDLRAYRLDNVTLGPGVRVWRFDPAASLQLTYLWPVASWVDLEIGAGAEIALTLALGDSNPAAGRVGPRLSLGAAIIQRFYFGFDAEYFVWRELYGRYARLPVPIAGNWEISAAGGVRFLWQ